MIAKIIVHGRDRQEAIARMRRALEMTVIEGIKTSIPLHLRILNDPDFLAGKLSTVVHGALPRAVPTRRPARRSRLDEGREASTKITKQDTMITKQGTKLTKSWGRFSRRA